MAYTKNNSRKELFAKHIFTHGMFDLLPRVWVPWSSGPGPERSRHIDKQESFWIKLVGFSVLIAPFFIGPKYSPDIDLSSGSNITDDTINGFCYVNRTLQALENGVDENVVSELSSYKYFIPLAYVIIGIGGMVLWPLSLAFIDTNAKEYFVTNLNRSSFWWWPDGAHDSWVTSLYHEIILSLATASVWNYCDNEIFCEI